MTNTQADKTGVSIVIPAYNEEGGISSGIRDVKKAMDVSGFDYELLIVNDGSEDKTAELAEQEGATVISLPENQGYGAALKAGIRKTKYEIIVITDADGTYPAERIPDLVGELGDYDMVVGARTGENVAAPLVRMPAKWFLRKLASYLAGRTIPDLNSGLRVMRKDLIRRFVHLLPQGFSFTTTITLASLCSGCFVKYIPIDYHARIGKSKIKPSHAFDFLLLIIRNIVYFNPLKVFLPLGGVFFLGGLAKFIYDLFIGDLSETAIMGFIGAFVLWAVGLISDQISKMALKSDGL